MQSDLYKACEIKIQLNNISWNELADLYNIPSGKILKDRFYRARASKKYTDNPENIKDFVTEPHEEEEPNYKNTTKINEDGTQFSDRLIMISENDSKNPKLLMELHGYDSDEWVLVNAISNFWNGMRPKDAGLVTLHQSKILVRPKSDKDITFEDVNKFFNNLDEKKIPNIKSEIRQFKPGGLVLEIDFADGHIGNESLTFEQVMSRIKRTVEEIKRRTKGLVLEKIVLAQMGDIFHMDTYNRTTTSGTQMTYGTTPNTMFDNGIELMVWMITELSIISKIEVVNLYGNHDKLTSYTLSKVIETYFRNDDNVEVDATQGVIKFRKFGISSVGFVHGDMPKNNIYDTFQKEGRKLFGETVYSEIHVAHLHHEIALEKGGVITRWVPSITSPDEYHVNNGYTGAKQGVQCFLWDLDNGLESIWMIPVGNIT